MKILSLNLHCFKEDNYLVKFRKIASFIQENGIDVCLFQEVCQHQNSPIVKDNIRTDNSAYYIAKAIGYNIYFHQFKLGFQVYEEGLAILSRHEISNPSYITISKTKDFNNWLRRDLIWARIKDITFYNVHLGWSIGDELIDTQIDNLLKNLDYKENLVLAGDFNYPDQSAPIMRLKEKLYSAHDLLHFAADRMPTFHFELDSKLSFDNRMIDFIFFNKPLNLRKYELVFNDKSTYVSDHSGILIEL